MPTIVTKLEAAVRQLDTAIRLFFDEGDAVSIHSLAVAATNVFSDLAEQTNSGVSWRTRMRDDSGLSMKQLKAVMHDEWNFFKHADRDPSGTLSFNEQLGEDFMFMATVDCGDLRTTTCLMQAFQIWYIAAHPERFPADEPLFVDAKQLLAGLASQGRSEQRRRGRSFLAEHCV